MTRVHAAELIVPVPRRPEVLPFAGEVRELASKMRRWRRGELSRLGPMLRRLNRDGRLSSLLCDELSPYVDRAAPEGARDVRRAPRESIITRLLRTGATAGRDVEVNVLVSTINPLLRVRRAGLRAEPLWSQADSLGRRSWYCDPQDVQKHLDQITREVALCAPADPLLAAAYALVAVMAVHPYYDGNGRLGRILFNLLFPPERRGLYIPLFEIGGVSDGGYLLALRRAQFGGDWSCMGRYLRGAVAVCLGAQSAFDADAEARVAGTLAG